MVYKYTRSVTSIIAPSSVSTKRNTSHVKSSSSVSWFFFSHLYHYHIIHHYANSYLLRLIPHLYVPNVSHPPTTIKQPPPVFSLSSPSETRLDSLLVSVSLVVPGNETPLSEDPDIPLSHFTTFLVCDPRPNNSPKIRTEVTTKRRHEPRPLFISPTFLGNPRSDGPKLRVETGND